MYCAFILSIQLFLAFSMDAEYVKM